MASGYLDAEQSASRTRYGAPLPQVNVKLAQAIHTTAMPMNSSSRPGRFWGKKNRITDTKLSKRGMGVPELDL